MKTVTLVDKTTVNLPDDAQFSFLEGGHLVVRTREEATTTFSAYAWESFTEPPKEPVRN